VAVLISSDISEKAVRLIPKLIVLSSCLLPVGAFSQTSLSERNKLPVARGVQAPNLALHKAPITSRAALDSYMKMTPETNNPLMLLSAEARTRFIDSLTFNETGVTGFRTDDLERELTPSKIYKILALEPGSRRVRTKN
jgi:hypothetical protein